MIPRGMHTQKTVEPLELIIAVPVIAALWLSARSSYLLFHSLVEMCSIAILGGVFMVAWNSRFFSENQYLFVLGVAAPFVALVDLFHTLAYNGMPIFRPGPNLPTQFWIAGRYVWSVSLLLAPLFIGRKRKPLHLFAGYSGATALMCVAIFGGVFPDCFVVGHGLTHFKIGSEYAVSAAMLAALVLLWRRKNALAPFVFRALAAMIILSVVSEMAFTFYSGVYDWINLLGHILKLLASYLLYKATIQASLMHPYELLFREIRDLNRQLVDHAFQLESANQELRAFNSSVSHDLRNPLNAIQLYASMLLHECGDGMGDKAAEMVRRIQGSAGQMSDIIEGLLTLSQVTRAELKYETVDLSEIANAMSRTLRDQQPSRDVEFLTQPGLEVKGDSRLMHVLLENLIGNAWKFTSKCLRALIEIGSRAGADGETVYYVRDNGVGFDPAKATKLFTPFERLHTRAEFPGSGIGLSTVERIVRRHGGRVWAESVPGEGATFYFTVGQNSGAPAVEGQSLHAVLTPSH